MSAQDPYQSPAQSSAAYPVAPQSGIKDVLFSFNGRIPRRTYWIWYLVTMGIFFVIAAVGGALSGPSAVEPSSASALAGPEAAPAPGAGAAIFGIIALILYIPMIWIGLALQAKRWHDRGKSAWWILINLIPFVGGIWAFIECGCLRGTVGPNQYGQDPT